MARTYKEWTSEEEEQLAREARIKGDTGKEWDDIGRLFGVSGASARNKWAAMRRKSGELRSTAYKEEEPTHQQLFSDLKDKRMSITQLCNKYDRSPDVIRARLEAMSIEGYYLVESTEAVTIPTTFRPDADLTPDISIADLLKQQEFTVGIISDIHSGSNTSQPTSLHQFVNYAHERYGVTIFLQPGDVTQGIKGYKGIDKDLIPAARPLGSGLEWAAVQRQVEIADAYFPRINGITYYMLGGNHDWWNVIYSGIDPVRRLCDRRNDMIYLAYDNATVPLTDATHIRLWHPTGGRSYAKSYTLQRKGLEPQAVEALREAIRLNESPKVSVLISGHVHYSLFLPNAPLYGITAGCFQAQTNLGKRIGSFPDVGGTILKFTFDDAGRIAQVHYIWRSFEEIKDDWKNFPIPEVEELNLNADPLETIYEMKEV
jgi:hypothetical protein